MADHPPPWEWRDHGLFDAADNVLIEIGYTELPWSNSDHAEQIAFASTYVEVATAAAGEMEALLREFEWRPGQHDPSGTKRKCLTCAADHACGEPHDPGCRIAALLARLDEARKAGG